MPSVVFPLTTLILGYSRASNEKPNFTRRSRDRNIEVPKIGSLDSGWLFNNLGTGRENRLCQLVKPTRSPVVSEQ
jgi:hypothetical protein